MPVLIRSIHLMMLQSYIIIPEKQEKSVNACALFYGMCQNPNCVGRLHIIELCSGRCPQAYGQYDGPACQRVYMEKMGIKNRMSNIGSLGTFGEKQKR